MRERRPESGSLKYTLKKCRYCGGSGYTRVGFSLCPACGGKGKVLVVKPAAKCGACKGTGLGLMGNDTCPACAGTGWAYTRTVD